MKEDKIIKLAKATEAVQSYYRRINGKLVQVKPHTRAGTVVSADKLNIPTDVSLQSLTPRIKGMSDQKIAEAILVITRNLRRLKPQDRARALVFLKALSRERSVRQKGK